MAEVVDVFSDGEGCWVKVRHGRTVQDLPPDDVDLRPLVEVEAQSANLAPPEWSKGAPCETYRAHASSGALPDDSDLDVLPQIIHDEDFEAPQNVNDFADGVQGSMLIEELEAKSPNEKRTTEHRTIQQVVLRTSNKANPRLSQQVQPLLASALAHSHSPSTS